ncbi:MAG TPA: hypothetical protein VFG91_14780 [Woeseiaceae bacterium]|nr:hypothetical protein [Woeseiaceae bacterium]
MAAKVPEQYVLKPRGKRLLILRNEKQKILEQLASLGIARGTIYPEIENVSEYIRDLYRATT